ncbi:MAG: hypothetical protein ISQ11_04615 [Planctomycetes bacterium]|nr:hypothetical protein [Planctomycetota bacterium]
MTDAPRAMNRLALALALVLTGSVPMESLAAQSIQGIRLAPAQGLSVLKRASAVKQGGAVVVINNAAGQEGPAPPAPELEPVVKELPPELLARLAGLEGQGLDSAEARTEAGALFSAAAAYPEGVDLLKDELRNLSRGKSDAVTTRRILGWVAWRHGDLKDATREFKRLAKDEGDLDSRLAYAQLLDARGETVDALEAYGALLPDVADSEQRTRLRLRMALMSMETGGEDQKDALAGFAREPGVTPELRNRCATVLALLGRPGEAAALYVVPTVAPEGAPTDEVKRRRKAAANGELRVAEWSIGARDWARAQDAAWRGVHLSTVARERRYGLTLLAEAHRGDGSLPALLERFDSERDGLPPEARRMWIELLRETGETDEAIAMTQGDSAATFSREDRVRLLEMYREADRVEEMLGVYREWIAGEPDELLWRQGLCRHYLENGDRAAAIDVWESWFPAEDTGSIEPGALLQAAEMLRSLGLDELAVRAAERVVDSAELRETALLFLFELRLERGQIDAARESLDRLDGMAPAGSAARMPLSDGYERIGELESAVRTLEGVRAARGEGRAGEDLEMRLAWLYSEVGREEQALELWRELWRRVKSLARRRFVEDRMMTVAARLGVLADIAIDIERKLVGGEATDRDSGLLVRLYTKVGDAVSAAEIIDEFLKLKGGSELEALSEKARVYLACNDFFNYEEAVGRLIEIDPDGRPDYYRQLAMSQLERGRPDEARTTLMRLQELPGGDDSSAEFEAGVLSLSGMREEAIDAYRRGLVAHPERIDSYLLMAGLMKQVKQADRAVGMFQFLAETAPKDDVFTIAIDGLLNMLVDAPPRPEMVQWARRITLERLAGREDAAYLYQLLADLAEETGDDKGQVTALQSLLASAGPRRASVLRELMELSKPARASFNVKGREGDEEQLLAFGRRLVGLGELVPPEVFLDLGDAFLEAGDERSAARTFDLTREFPDGEMYQKNAAERFEKAGYTERSLERYQAVLAASPSDIGLLTKVGELREALGDDAAALELYRRAHGILIGRRLLLENKREEEEDKLRRFMPRNVDELDQFGERVLRGMLATMTEAELDGFLADQVGAVELELPRAFASADADRGGEGVEPSARRIAQHPRLGSRAEIVRRVSFGTGRVDAAQVLDERLLAAFPGDDRLLEDAMVTRVRWGLVPQATVLLASLPEDRDDANRWRSRLGGGSAELGDSGGQIPFDEAVAAALTAVAAGDLERVRAVVQRANVGRLEEDELQGMAVLFAAARSADDEELSLRVARDWLRLSLASSPNPYQIEELIDALVPALGEETGLALARYLVGLIVGDPEKNSRLVRVLPKLADRFGEAAVSAEQVQALVDGFSEAYAFGLVPVLLLLPEEDRSSSLRSIWSKLEAQGRARFLLGMIAEAPGELPEEMANFIRDSLPGALEDGADLLEFYVSRLVDVPHSHQLVLDVCREIRSTLGSQVEILDAAIVIHRCALEGPEALVGDGAQAFVALAADSEDDYQRRQASEQLAAAFDGPARDAFMAALAEEAPESSTATALDFARALLYFQWDRPGDALALLEGFEPDEETEWRRLDLIRDAQLQLGQELAAAQTLIRRVPVAKDDDDKKRVLRQAVRAWERLEAPEIALEAQRMLDDLGDGSEPGSSGFVLPPGTMSLTIGAVTYNADDKPEKEGLPRTFREVREALGAGQAEDAARIFRRLWREFPVGQPAARMSSFLFYRRSPLGNLRWPGETAPSGDDPGAEARRQGGLVAFRAPEAPERPPAPDAYEKLAAYPEIVAEQERYLRGVQPAELDRIQKLTRGMLQAEVAERGAEVVLERLLAEVRRSGGRLAQIQLLTLLDLHPALISGEAAVALEGLVSTMPPMDAAQVMRLARTLLRSGDRGMALRLYEWCALIGIASESPFGDDGAYVISSVPLPELIEDVKENLVGDERIAPIAALLRSMSGGRPWEVERTQALAVKTWAELVGPAEALQRLGKIAVDSLDLSKGLQRSVAVQLAPLYLASGDEDRALRALEVGTARFKPAEVSNPDRFWMAQPEEPMTLPGDVLEAVLPEGGAGLEEPGRWFKRFAESHLAWLGDGRLREDTTVQALALCAVRMGEVGLADEAMDLALGLADLEGIPARARLWVVDALRELGGAEAAERIEVQMLTDGELLTSRVAGVVEGVLEREGPEAALAVGAPTAAFSRPEALTAALIRAATEAGDEDAVARWTKAAETAARAAEKLEERKAEAAKK